MKTNSLDKLADLLKKNGTSTPNSLSSQIKQQEKIKHREELKAAKKAYKESLLHGEDKINQPVTQPKPQTPMPTGKHMPIVPVEQLSTTTVKRKKNTHISKKAAKRLIAEQKNQKVDNKIKERINRKLKANKGLNSRRKEWIERLHESMGISTDVVDNTQNNSSFNRVVKSEEFPLQWEHVTFGDGHITINPFTVKVKNFTPFSAITVDKKNSRKSFNYLRKYFKKELPAVMCYTHTVQGLVFVDTFKIEVALIALRKLSEKEATVEIEENVKKQSNFEYCVDKGRQMTPSEFRRFKSKFIDYLISSRKQATRVIPCQECLRYETTKETSFREDAFIFILQNNDGTSTIVYENLNPDRSTLIFRAETRMEMDAARQIFTFMCSNEINKRSCLRNRWVKMKGHGIKGYRSINHTDIYDWKATLKHFQDYRSF